MMGWRTTAHANITARKGVPILFSNKIDFKAMDIKRK